MGLTILRKASVPGGWEYTLDAGNDNTCKTVYLPFSNHSEIYISTATGCHSSCLICPYHNKRHSRPLVSDEIRDQLSQVEEDQEVDIQGSLVIHYGEIGDPMANSYSVVSSLSKVLAAYDKSKIIISSPGIIRSPRFIKKVGSLSESHKERVVLRFSKFSTSQEENMKLIGNPNVITFDEISKLSKSWEGSPIRIGIVSLKGYQLNSDKIIEKFDPKKVEIEICPLIMTQEAKRNHIEEEDPIKILSFAAELKKEKFNVFFNKSRL